MDRLEQYGGQAVSSIEELMEVCDIVVATTGVPGLIKPAFVRSGQVILALSNPKPEIERRPQRRLAPHMRRTDVLLIMCLASRYFQRSAQRKKQGDQS